MAVEQERARISRDLHDLLGQSLFLIGVKGEIAARHVAATEPGGAEIRDVVRLARETLREMRRVVSGSRQPALDAELGAARGALDAAGIAVEIAQSLGPLPRTLEALLGWTVREGVTNVIRHSRAATCRIVLTREGRLVRADVVDDGAGPDAPGGGNGLGGSGGDWRRLAASSRSVPCRAAASGCASRCLTAACSASGKVVPTAPRERCGPDGGGRSDPAR